MISETKVNNSFPIGNFLMMVLALHPFQIVILKMDVLGNMLGKIFHPIYLKCKINQQKTFMQNQICKMTNGLLIVLIILIKTSEASISTNQLNLEIYVLLIMRKRLYLEILLLKLNYNHLKSFCENYRLKNQIKQLTCYKNPSNPTYIDLILTNVPRRF